MKFAALFHGDASIRQLCNNEPDERIRNYCVEDFKSLLDSSLDSHQNISSSLISIFHNLEFTPRTLYETGCRD